MTTQDLKNNRNEIIAELQYVVAPQYIVKCMQMMLNLAEGDMLNGDDAEEVVEEIVNLFPEYKKSNQRVFDGMTNGERNSYNARRNAPSSLR